MKQILLSTTLLAVLSIMAGCATTDIKVPPTTKEQQAAALHEIEQAPMVTNRYVPLAEADRAVAELYESIAPAARDVCLKLEEDECIWDIELSSDSELNAYASGESKVVIQRGIFNYAKNDTQSAFVLAHEIAHHIADHLHESQVNATRGALLGGLLMGAVSAAASNRYDPYASQRVANDMQSGIELGAALGALSYSVAQEKEADFIAMQIIADAGYDPREARGFLITMAQLSGKKATGALDSHPAGPERLATFDRVLGMSSEEFRLVAAKLAPASDASLDEAAIEVAGSAPHNANNATNVAASEELAQTPRVPAPAEITAAAEDSADPVAVKQAAYSVAAAPSATHNAFNSTGRARVGMSSERALAFNQTQDRSATGELSYEYSAQKIAFAIGCDRNVHLLTQARSLEVYQTDCVGQQTRQIRCEFSSCKVVEY